MLTLERMGQAKSKEVHFGTKVIGPIGTGLIHHWATKVGDTWYEIPGTGFKNTGEKTKSQHKLDTNPSLEQNSAMATCIVQGTARTQGLECMERQKGRTRRLTASTRATRKSTLSTTFCATTARTTRPSLLISSWRMAPRNGAFLPKSPPSEQESRDKIGFVN